MIEPTGRGVLDFRMRGERQPRVRRVRHALILRRRQRHSSVAISTIASPAAIAPLMKRPPGRSIVRERNEGVSPGRARRNATTLSPIVVPDSE